MPLEEVHLKLDTVGTSNEEWGDDIGFACDWDGRPLPEGPKKGMDRMALLDAQNRSIGVEF